MKATFTGDVRFMQAAIKILVSGKSAEPAPMGYRELKYAVIKMAGEFQ